MDNPDITYKVSASDLKSAIDVILSDLVKNSILAPYQYRIIGTMAACEILGISESTIRRYIKDRKLIPLESKSNHHHFSLKDLLEFNIAKIKYHNSR